MRTVHFLPSRNIMKSAIEKYSFALTEHHVCPFCENYIGTVHSSVFHCDNCDKDASVAVNKTDGNMFLYLPLREQIKALLETLPEELVDPRNRKKINSLNYEDIFDGSIYKLIAAADTITMKLFIDGVQKATSKASAWPVLVTINELSIRLRRKHVLMACLWLSKRKPKCNEYLKPLVKECKELARTGVSFCRNGVTRVLKVKPCCFISDSIARPLTRNSMKFNGRFGCGFCLHPGVMMQCGRGTTRSYTTCDTVYPSRTHEQLMELARSADALGVPQQGIKGVSIVSELPHIDMVRCIDFDSFHAVVNVAKRFCNLWFLSPPRDVPVPAYKIHTNLGAVDKRLLSVTPTSDVSRAPGSLTERSDFRGHEWFYFVLIYSVPVLKNIFPLRYLNHWSLLVKGLAMLMQNSIAKSETVYADRHLQNFVSGIDVLYGAQNVTFSSPSTLRNIKYKCAVAIEHKNKMKYWAFSISWQPTHSGSEPLLLLLLLLDACLHFLARQTLLDIESRSWPSLNFGLHVLNDFWWSSALAVMKSEIRLTILQSTPISMGSANNKYTPINASMPLGSSRGNT
ncbi:hypothetical protein ONE63_011305 [Megalurothrips usitatus]|uniref:Uncharacterized protein n=1 Tax=Megalurothrips usitatus TaxID=439358 RepID=A0AAV7X350_9NEOP|nr:hypothetical protein ONE63_011305 [Megalurothrips usitatus]